MRYFIAQGRYQLFVLCREASEDVLRDNDSLLYCNRLAILDDVSDYLNSFRHGFCDFEDYLANRFDTCSDEIEVDVVAVVLQLTKNTLCVLLVDYLNQDLDFLQFYIERIVELTEEHLYVIFKQGRLLLHNKVDVSQRDILKFSFAGKECDKWCRHLLNSSLS